MNDKINRGMKIIKWILGGMLIFSFLFFIIGENVLPENDVMEGSTFQNFEAQWVQEMPDGTKTPVTIPGNCDVSYGEWGVISTQLPENQTDTWLCARSMQQELNIYVGEELRKAYSTLETQKFGKTSTMTYVLFPIYESDAGKTLRIEFMSKSNYANYVSDIYQGEEEDIKSYFLYHYGAGAILAALIFLIGLMVIVVCLLIRIWYKREVDLLYLGHVLLIASTWLIAESKVRQFILPSTTVAMWMGFLMIALLPYPFVCYVNDVQKGRYQKAYFAIGVCTVINFVVMMVLQMFNIKDFFETMGISHAIIASAGRENRHAQSTLCGR